MLPFDACRSASSRTDKRAENLLAMNVRIAVVANLVFYNANWREARHLGTGERFQAGFEEEIAPIYSQCLMADWLPVLTSAWHLCAESKAKVHKFISCPN